MILSNHTIKKTLFVSITMCFLLILSLLLPTDLYAVDSDGNGIEDEFEMPLAQKFCPSLVLHSEDQGVCPEPVEIIGTNYTNNMLIRVYNSPLGQYVGEFRPDEFYPSIYSYFCLSAGYPEFCNGNYSFLALDPWTYVGTPEGKAYGVYYLVFHWEWAGVGDNHPSWWYAYYHNVKNNYNNTVYAHLFKLNQTQYVIQYWLFYPFNDFVNDHEGDWEHINVIIDEQDPVMADILSVEYFFHHKVDDRSSSGYDYHLEDGTHPVVFVGGYEKVDHGGSSGEGPGSHGSFPIYGFWEDTGNPIPGYGRPDETVDGQGYYLRYNTFDIEIIPNPDAIDYNQNPSMSWLKANIPWGHIQVQSYGDWLELIPFLGTDVGNNAPLGPAYNPGWNDVGEAWGEESGYRWYTTSNQGPIPSWVPPTVSINLLSPNGGEDWKVDWAYDITWNSFNFYGFVKIEYSTDGGASWLSVVDRTSNEGVYTWTIPDNPSNSCRVKVSNAVDGDPYDISDNDFIISYPLYAPVISADYGSPPNLGILISWGDNNSYETGYKIERKDPSHNWSEIASLGPNTTSYLDSYLDLVGSETYSYRVYACYGNRKSDPSNTVTIKNLPNPARSLVGWAHRICEWPSDPGILSIGPDPDPGPTCKRSRLVKLKWKEPYPQKLPVYYIIYYQYQGQLYWSESGPIYDITFDICLPLSQYRYNFYVDAFESGSGIRAWHKSNQIRVTTGSENCPSSPSPKLHHSFSDYVFSLSPNYPNPFNARTELKFCIPTHANVKLEIYNVLGRKILTLVDETLEPGYHSVFWKGEDKNGQKVSSGVYFYKIKSEQFQDVKKMLLVK